MMNQQGTIRCVVVQLARLGDTLQSLMALRAAKQLYPQLEIHFIAREKFASAAKRVPWIQQVITLPTDEILGPILQGIKTETASIRDIARWIAPLVQQPWDIAVNWSFSEASSYLMGLLPSRVKLGYTRRRDSSFLGADGWSHYIQGVVQGGGSQNIHLTDILTTQLLTALQIHVGESSADGNSPVTSKGFFSLICEDDSISFQQNPNKKWIAIQLGAGKKEKTWDPRKWAKFAKYILSRHPEFGIFLVGGKEDMDRSHVFANEIKDFVRDPQSVISLVGNTSFDRWASVISRCQWVCSGDTAAIHLASVLGTRVLNLSLGPVRHYETGPYGNGHYVVNTNLYCEACEKPSLQNIHTCGQDISPEAAYAIWSYASNEWAHRRQISLESHFSQLGWLDHLESIRVFRSRIRNTSDGGGVSYDSIVNRPLRLSDWMASVMGHVARAWYCGWVPTVGQELNRETISPALIQKIREIQDSADVLFQICNKATTTATLLNKKSASLKSEKVMRVHDREELRELGKTLLELETLIDRVGKTQPLLSAFSQMLKVLMHNLRGTQLSDLGKETADCYQQLGEGVGIFKDWVKYTLELAKPVAIQPGNNLAFIHPKKEKEITP